MQQSAAEFAGQNIAQTQECLFADFFVCTLLKDTHARTLTAAIFVTDRNFQFQVI